MILLMGGDLINNRLNKYLLRPFLQHGCFLSASLGFVYALFFCVFVCFCASPFVLGLASGSYQIPLGCWFHLIFLAAIEAIEDAAEEQLEKHLGAFLEYLRTLKRELKR